MASHLASLWKWDFLELGSGLLGKNTQYYGHTGQKQALWSRPLIAVLIFLYEADISAKFDKNLDSTSFSRELS